MCILRREPITSHRFADWTMRYRRMMEPTEPSPAGFRDTFDDLDPTADAPVVGRAVDELSRWFRYRTEA